MHPALLLLLVLLAVAALLVGALLFLMANFLLRPPRMLGGRAIWLLQRLSPRDLNLPYEDLQFTVHQESNNSRLRLTAWWIPFDPAQGRPVGAPSVRTVVIIHGYADSKIGGIAWAHAWRSLGFNVLAVDLRAHGESDGKYTTAGFYERHDLSQVIDQIRAQRPAHTREIVLFGVSLGAAVALGAARMRDDIAAVILDSPYADYARAAHTHANVMGMPGPFFQRHAIRLAEKIAGADFTACSPEKLIPLVRTPLMVIQGSADLLIDPADIATVEAAARARAPGLLTEYWRIEGTHHVLALAADPGEFVRRIGAFVARATEKEIAPA